MSNLSTRRLFLGLTLTAALAATAQRASPQDPASIPAPIRRMIEEAHLRFTRGNAAAAADLFEQAAAHGDYTEAEVGEVRARLWAGQFRHAVTISSAVAGEHPESAEAQALQGYIEDRSGYITQALQRLRNEQKIHPRDPAPVAAEAEVLIDRHSATEAIELIDRWVEAQGPQPDVCRLRVRAALVRNSATAGRNSVTVRGSGWRCETLPAHAPSATGASCWSAPAFAKFPATLGSPVGAGNGLITDEGRRVITLRRLFNSSSLSVWVRNARGELRQAQLDPPDGHSEPQDERSSRIATLSLDKPFAADESLVHTAVAPPDTHGLCFVLGFPAALSMDAMLPAVTPCFALAPRIAQDFLNINIPLGESEGGSPVFDAQGRLLGLANPPLAAPATAANATPQKTRALASIVRSAGGHPPERSAAQGPQPTLPMPELYERLAPAVVQVLIFGPAQ